MTDHKGLGSALRLVPRLGARALVQLYRYTLSPLIGFHCRHLPTCSEYADAALDRHGLWAGGWMTLARLTRCHPFGTSGLDVVPGAAPERARWYLPWAKRRVIRSTAIIRLQQRCRKSPRSCATRRCEDDPERPAPDLIRSV